MIVNISHTLHFNSYVRVPGIHAEAPGQRPGRAGDRRWNGVPFEHAFPCSPALSSRLVFKAPRWHVIIDSHICIVPGQKDSPQSKDCACPESAARLAPTSDVCPRVSSGRASLPFSPKMLHSMYIYIPQTTTADQQSAGFFTCPPIPRCRHWTHSAWKKSRVIGVKRDIAGGARKQKTSPPPLAGPTPAMHS